MRKYELKNGIQDGSLVGFMLSDVTGLEKSHIPSTTIIMNTDFNYLKFCISGRKTSTCMQFRSTTVLYIAIHSLFIHNLLNQ